VLKQLHALLSAVRNSVDYRVGATDPTTTAAAALAAAIVWLGSASEYIVVNLYPVKRAPFRPTTSRSSPTPIWRADTSPGTTPSSPA